MNDIKKRLSSILESPADNANDKLAKVCHLLMQEITHYDWVGFYFRNGDKEELLLGPYAGAETDHKVIPFGRGICGQVAVSGKTFEVPDVTAEDNYLSCSSTTKAELVVPVFKEGENIGQIDIDSHTLDPFSKADTKLLEWLAAEVSEVI